MKGFHNGTSLPSIAFACLFPSLMVSVAGSLPYAFQSKYHTVDLFPSRTFRFKCQPYLIYQEMLGGKEVYISFT